MTNIYTDSLSTKEFSFHNVHDSQVMMSSASSLAQSFNISTYNGFELGGFQKVEQFKCSECTNKRQNNHQGSVGSIQPEELWKKLSKARNLNQEADFILIDTRDSNAYCSGHIISSMSFNCHSKIMARRAIKLWTEMFAYCNQCPAPQSFNRSVSFTGQPAQKKLPLHSVHSFCAICDLESLTSNKSSPYTQIIVYDEDGDQFSADFRGLPNAALPPLHLFLNFLIDHCNNVVFLEGGLKAFKSLDRTIEEFIDSGLNVSNLVSTKECSFEPTCRSKAISGPEHRVNCLAVNAAFCESSKSLNKNPRLDLPNFPTQRHLNNFKNYLNATFPPKSMPMTKLTLADVILTPEQEKADKNDSKDLKSNLPATGDIFGATISKVLPHLYLGNARDAQDKNLLEKLGITHILNVTNTVPNPWENKFVYLRLSALDNDQQNMRPRFEEAFHFIDQAIKSGGSVLVHCQAGVSRSVTIVIAYLLKTDRKLSLMQALERVQEIRPIAGPNLNFMGQLQAFHRELRSLPIPMDIDTTVKNTVGGDLKRGHSRSSSNGSFVILTGSHENLAVLNFHREASEENSPWPSISPYSSSSNDSSL